MDNILANIERINAVLAIIFEKRGVPVPMMPLKVEPFYAQQLAVYYIYKGIESKVIEACYYAAQMHCYRVIIIADDTDVRTPRCGSMETVSYRLFVYCDLLVDIFQHYLVPEQTLLSVEDSAEIKRRYKVRDDQMARMHVTDPVAMRLGAERGQVIMVRRNEDEVAYRCVV